MINIRDLIDNLFFVIFKRYIFKTNNKKNNSFETLSETFKNENENDNEEIWFLRDLKE
uniref:Uncharacterized protein n=1 Tax=viral metagenome TaxID=1070528 RepID=A0A6C0IG08_9ZZZZ